MLDESAFFPFQAAALPAGPWLVVAPHPDDEAFGMGGALLLAARRAIPVDVLFLTSGDHGVDPALGDLREGEARRAAKALNIRDLVFWRLPDRGVAPSPAVIARLAELIAARGTATVFFPSPDEPHPDHRAAAVIAWETLRRTRFAAVAWSYEVALQGPVNRLIDVTAVAAAKREVMALHASQMRRVDHRDRILGMNRGRAWSLPANVTHAEAFYAWPAVDEPLNTLALDLEVKKFAPTALPAPAPTVSVVIRTKDRPVTLRRAIASVAAQTHRDVELVVVNDGGIDVAALVAEHVGGSIRRWHHHVLSPGRGRAAAANAGLDLASGEWVMLLDDDDTIRPDHLAGLLAAAAREPHPGVVFSAAKGVDADGREVARWDRPFRPARLTARNFAPIHAVLFRRALVGDDVRFDPAFDLYEDWDFWTGLARRAAFVGTGEITAIYHMNDTSTAADAPHRQTAGRLQYYAKWLARLRPDELNATMVELDALEHEVDGQRRTIAELNGELDRTRTALAAATSDRDTRYRDLERLFRDLEQSYWALERHHLDMKQDLETRLAEAVAPKPNAVAAASKAVAARTAGLFAPLRDLFRRRPVDAPPAEPVSEAAPDVAALRELTRAQARAELIRFLESDETLRLPRPPAGATPRVSVVIVLFNQAGLTLECLRSLATQTGVDFETIVVDNASTDETADLMRRVEGVRYLRNAENEHFLRAVNLAADHATGEYLLLLNNDATLGAHALARAVRRLASSAAIGAVGGSIVLPDGTLQEAGCIVWNDGSCLGVGRGDDPRAPQYRFVRRVDYCSGAFLLTRRALFEDLGRFDEQFAPAYYEETDYCVRLHEAGHEIVYDPTIEIRHIEYASSDTVETAIDRIRRNQAIFVDKHRAFLAGQHPPTLAAVAAARQRLPAGARRILIVDDRVPHPHLGSGFPRANMIVRMLAEAGHAVTLYPHQFPDDDWAAVYESLPDTVEVMVGLGGAGFADFLAERRGLYDVVLVSRPHNMATLRGHLARTPDLLRAPDAPAPRLIYDAEALFACRERIRARLFGTPLSDAEADAALMEELALADAADEILTVSEVEANHFRAAGHARVTILGHAIEQRPTTTPFAERTRILFVGAVHESGSPNADGLRWFAASVWPKIRARLGDAVELDVVGPCVPEFRAELSGAGIVVHGAVADLDPLFERARLFVVPTRFAAGIPHKAHLAAAYGVPMIATTLIAEQLGWQDAVPNTDDPSTFAEHCLDLYRDEAAWTAHRDRLLVLGARDCGIEAFRTTLSSVVGADRIADEPRGSTGAMADVSR